MKNLKILKKVLSAIVASVLLLLPASAAFAITEEQLDLWNLNNIYYYDPEGCENDESATHLAGSNVAEVVWNYLLDHGYSSTEVISGILGNIQVESGMDPFIVSASGSYGGLIQTSHVDELKQYVNSKVPGASSYWHQGFGGSGAPVDIVKKAAYAEMQFFFEVEPGLVSSTNQFKNDLGVTTNSKGAAGARAYSDLWLVRVERAVNGNSEIEDPGVKRIANSLGYDLYQGSEARRDAAESYYGQFKNYNSSVVADRDTESSGSSSVLVIGDSLTVGSVNALTSAGISSDMINARVSRPFSEGISELKNALQDKDPSIIVFALGTNNVDGINKQQISEVLGLAGDRQVIFVNNWTAKNSYTENNQLFAAAAKENKNVKVVDWASAVSQDQAKYLAADGIHPSAAGTELFAKLVSEKSGEAVNSAADLEGDICMTRYAGSGNNDINATAIALSWDTSGHSLNDPRPEYKKALAKTGVDRLGDHYSMIGASCDAFVATVYRYSGVDPNFACCGVSAHGATWQYVTNSGKFVEVPNNRSSLKPGDIRMSNGHIEIYVEVGGQPMIASASHGDRTGELLPYYDNAGTFKAYRFKN